MREAMHTLVQPLHGLQSVSRNGIEDIQGMASAQRRA